MNNKVSIIIIMVVSLGVRCQTNTFWKAPDFHGSDDCDTLYMAM